jgi:CPA2 family monovalent cation:H+ antiporter-2
MAESTEVALFLRDAAVVLGVAVTVLLVCGRLRLPSVVGLLLTGLLIGPSGMGLLREAADVEVFAELGVVLLLFAIGIELSLERLRELRRLFLLGGGGQTTLTIAAVTAAALWLGFGWRNGLFLGFLVALSSTAVVVKLLQEREETETPPGRAALGILLYQDFLVVPMIVVLPVLGGEGGSWVAILLRFAISLCGLLLLFYAARFLFPRLLRAFAFSRLREAFLLGALGVCAGTALLTERLGFSLALGAFLAGVLVSESEYSAQIHADVGPLRDVFASIFFLSVGMLVDLPAVAGDWLAVGLLAGGIVALKLLLAAAAVGGLGYPLRPALVTGFLLAQVGEFSFVLLGLGQQYALVDPDLYQRVLGASVLTLAATPILVQVAPAVVERLLPRARGAAADPATSAATRGHVLVGGYGVNGQVLARMLAQVRVPFVVIELDPGYARAARDSGVPVVFGDATRREILEHAGVREAKMLVLALSDDRAAERALRVAKELNPELLAVVRTRALDGIPRLRRAGADEVIAEEFETGIEILTRVLERYHVPRHLIRTQTRVLRGESYEMLRAPRLGGGVSDAVMAALQAGTTDLYQVAAGSPAAGRSLAELELRQRCGATVVAVVRDGEATLSPPGDHRLAPNDILVLVGSHAQIDRAFGVLAPEPAAPSPAPPAG